MLHQTQEKNQESMHDLCNKILEIDDVRFAGIIDKYGNLYAGGFHDEVTPFENDDRRRSLYMSFALETAFRKDFDDSLGGFNYSLVQRDKVSILTVPICNHVLLVILEPLRDTLPTVSKIQKMVKENKVV